MSPEVSKGRDRAVKAPRDARPTKMVVASLEELLDIISVTIGTKSMPQPPTKLQKPKPKTGIKLIKLKERRKKVAVKRVDVKGLEASRSTSSS